MTKEVKKELEALEAQHLVTNSKFIKAKEQEEPKDKEGTKSKKGAKDKREGKSVKEILEASLQNKAIFIK